MYHSSDHTHTNNHSYKGKKPFTTSTKYSKLNFCFFIPKHLFFCVLNITYILPHFTEKRKQKMGKFPLKKNFPFLYSYYISSVNDIRDICCSHHYSVATFRFFCPLPFCTQWHLRSILRPHILKLFPPLSPPIFKQDLTFSKYSPFYTDEPADKSAKQPKESLRQTIH